MAPAERFIRNARILLPNGQFLRGNVAIQEHRIIEGRPAIAPSSSEGINVIDAEGLTLLPRGLILRFIVVALV